MRDEVRPVADVDKDVAGGVKRKAAGPEPAGILDAHTQAPAQPPLTFNRFIPTMSTVPHC